jgi:hypothetical protein
MRLLPQAISMGIVRVSRGGILYLRWTVQKKPGCIRWTVQKKPGCIRWTVQKNPGCILCGGGELGGGAGWQVVELGG